jgi:NAD(P)-dependent dehydrogenase (short-subunit alcohol dehydrogenase family)
MKNVIVITGASSGFGALAARALARAGHTVYASMRETTGRNAPQVKEAEQYAAEHGVDLRAIELDVSSQKSCDAAIQEIISKNGRLDVLIHNAGHMVFGPAEAFTPEQLAELYDVNVLSTPPRRKVAVYLIIDLLRHRVLRHPLNLGERCKSRFLRLLCQPAPNLNWQTRASHYS